MEWKLPQNKTYQNWEKEKENLSSFLSIKLNPLKNKTKHNFPTKDVSDPAVFTGNFSQIFKE